MKKISKNKQLRLKTKWTEKELFLRIWNKLPHICMVTWQYIYEPQPACFAHILSKWLFPDLRYHENNIALVAWIKEHSIWDEWTLRYKQHYGHLNLEQDIRDGKDVCSDIILFNKPYYETTW